MKKSVLFICRSALIAALYFALSAALAAISFGPLQFRLSEALVMLAALMPEAIPGLTIGCILSNFAFSPYGLYDVLFGGLATLLGALGTYLLRRHLPLSALPPIIFNALLVPVVWSIDGGAMIYLIGAGEIFASELLTVAAIGIPFAYVLRKALLKAGLIKTEEVTRSRRAGYAAVAKMIRHSELPTDNNLSIPPYNESDAEISLTLSQENEDMPPDLAESDIFDSPDYVFDDISEMRDSVTNHTDEPK